MITLLFALSLICVLFGAPAATKEKKLTVYYGATLDQMSPVLAAFSAKYPEIKIKSYRSASEELSATMDMELRSRNPQFDVAVLGNGPIMTLQNKYSCFQPFTSEAKNSIASSLVDKAGVMTPVGTGFYVIIYNTNLVTKNDAPKSFKDLLDPKWKSKIVMADPKSSSSVYTFIWLITQHLNSKDYGWNYFAQLDALNVNYVASHGTIGELVSMGERSVGIQVMATAGTSLKKGDPIAVVYPAEGIPSEVNVGVIRKDSPNQQAAELFVNFILSKEGQLLVGKNLGWIPVRTDLDNYSLADGTPLSKINFIARDVTWVNSAKAEVIDKFSKLKK